jgi:hypothetical protein
MFACVFTWYAVSVAFRDRLTQTESELSIWIKKGDLRLDSLVITRSHDPSIARPTRNRSLQGFHFQSIFRTFEMLQRSQLFVDNDLRIRILCGSRQSAQSRSSWPVCDVSGCRQRQELFHTLSAAYLPMSVWHNALMAVKSRFCPAQNIDFAERITSFQSNWLQLFAQ